MDINPINVFVQLPYFVFFKNLKSEYLGCNMNLAQIAGLSLPNHIVGKMDDELPWAEQADLYRRGDQEVLDNATQLEAIEPLTLATGKTISLIIRKQPIFNEQGQKIGVVGNFSEYVSNKYYGSYLGGKENIMLPRRQADCLFYIALGLSVKQIADEMRVTSRTIESHMSILKIKLRCSSKSELTKKAWSIECIKQRLLAQLLQLRV